MIVVADTSAVFAAFDDSQIEHASARSVMLTQPLLVSPLVMTELDHLVHRDLGFPAALAVSQALIARMDNGQYRLAELSTTDLQRVHQVRERYSDLSLDLADAVGVVLAARHHTNLIFTLDQRDFRALRPLEDRFDSFHLLPMDGLAP